MLERIVGKRIILRRPRLGDAADIVKYCNDPLFAQFTLRVRTPYKKRDALAFINDCTKQWKEKKSYTYVIEHFGHVIGAISLRPEDAERAAMGYGIGRQHWGKGITTEAGKLMLREGFDRLKFNRIYAEHNVKNPASGRVMQKLGMKYEGTLREHERKDDEYWDVAVYGILRREFKSDNV